MVQAAVAQSLLKAPHGWHAVGTAIGADFFLDKILGGLGAAGRSAVPAQPAYGANVPQGGKYFISEQVLADYDRWYRGEMLRITALNKRGLGLPYPKSPQEWAEQVIDMRAKQGRELTQRDIARDRAQGEIALAQALRQVGGGLARDAMNVSGTRSKAYADAHGRGVSS